jgi:hypothetical protein
MILTLDSSKLVASLGDPREWYVDPFAATRWTVGRQTDNGHRYHILADDGEPITFETKYAALKFLLELLARTFPAWLLGKLRTWIFRN